MNKKIILSTLTTRIPIASLTFAITLSISGYASASAALISFDGLAPDPIPGAVYEDDHSFLRSINLNGFTIEPYGTQPLAEFSYVNNIMGIRQFRPSSSFDQDDSPNPYNGTNYLYFQPGIKINQIGNLPFSLNSFDLAIARSRTDVAFNDAVVTGKRSDGSTISQTITLDTTPNELKTIGNDFTHYNLTGFENLKSVVISWVERGHFDIDRYRETGLVTWADGGYYSFGIDNIDLTPSEIIPAPIPEPSTYAMLLAGLGLMGLGLKRHPKSSRVNA